MKNEAPPLRAKQDSITVVMVIEVNKEEATEGRGKNSSNCRFLSLMVFFYDLGF